MTQAVDKRHAPEGLVELGKLTGLKVVDTAGSLLGMVKRIEIDPADGRILTLETHQGGLLGIGGTTSIIAAGAVQGIGPEMLTVTGVLPDPSSQATPDRTK